MKQITKSRITRIVQLSLIGILLGVIVGYISTLLDLSDSKETISISVLGALLGLILGFQFGVLEEIIWRKLSKQVPYHLFNFIQFIVYLGLIIFWLIIGISAEHAINDGMSFNEGLIYYLREEDILRDIFFCVIMTIIITFFGKFRMLHSTGEFKNLLTGKYYYPVKENRIIAFIDLANSTAIAERLGSVSFSSYLQDCYSDVSEAILAWGGQVYQYVGDGIIISWLEKNKNHAANAVSCYFYMLEVLYDREMYYQNKYQTSPKLRCGIHKGEVVTTWVGEIRKELAFHGDTINTASRIQELCKVYKKDCLVSAKIIDGLKMKDQFQIAFIGEVLPRGKSEAIQLFSVAKTKERIIAK